MYYDPSYRKGTLNIAVYRYQSSEASSKQLITLYSDSIRTVGDYPLTIPNHQEGLYKDRATGCEFSAGESHYRRGTLTITRLNVVAGIISGTFEFTLAKPGCDTVRVTQGRFDKKL